MKTFNGKAIYNPSGKAGEYSYWACNFFTGCSNDCDYCYCKRGVMSSVWSTTPKLKKCFKDEKHAFEIFKKELKANLSELQKHGLFFSFTTDPLLSECSDLTWEAVMMAMENDVPVKLLTKVVGVWICQIIENLNPSWRNLIAFGFTLTGHDELEPNASPNAERIKAIQLLHDAGFKTWASIEPIIDFESSKEMIRKTAGYCDLYKIGLKSGKKYDKNELLEFIEYCNSVYITECKAGFYRQANYFKDTLLRQAEIIRENLPTNCVGRDYNIFNT